MARKKQAANDSPIYNPEIIQKGIEEACKYAEEKGIPLTLGRLCACINVDRAELIGYLKGSFATGEENEEKKNKRELSIKILKKAYNLCNAECEDSLAIGRGTIGNIFLAKNNYGYVDKVEVNTTEKVIFCGENDMQD
jgi:hypothetical protein